MVSVIADRLCDNQRGVGEASGIWWKDKKKVLVSNMNIDGRNVCKYENNFGA